MSSSRSLAIALGGWGWAILLACQMAALADEPKPSLPGAASELLGEALGPASLAGPPADPVDATNQPELITERYPDGSVKIERQVVQDAEGNYVNHGPYTEYDRNGKVVRSGEFRNGKPHGKWTRYFQAGECSLFSGALEKQFQGPFVSEATMVDGQLHGTWTIRGQNGQKIIEWRFENGVRHGTSTWWYPGGEIRREVTYKNGEPDGELVEWAADGQVTNRVTFIDGRQIVHEVQWSAPGKKAYEGDYLLPRSVAVPVYDWWAGTVKSIPMGSAGQKQKHGLWIGWYPNGQKKVAGFYEADVPTGKFTWWYENGQKQAEGEYLKGEQHNKWITWHPNGQKESEAVFTAGVLTGKWTRWQADGKKVEVFDPGLEETQDPGGSRGEPPQAETRAPQGAPALKAETLEPVPPVKRT